MHLQHRRDAFAPHCPHPQLGMARGAALNQRVQAFVGVSAAQWTALIPGMIRIIDAALGLLKRARPGALGPIRPGHPAVPVPAGTVIELDMTEALRLLLAVSCQRRDERQLAVVARIYFLRLALGFADHGGEFAHAGAERL